MISLKKGRLLAEKIMKVLIVAVITCCFSGCASVTNLNKTAGPIQAEGVENDPNTNSTDDSPYARSPQRQVGQGLAFAYLAVIKKTVATQRNSRSMIPSMPSTWNGSAGRSLRPSKNGRRSRPALPEFQVYWG